MLPISLTLVLSSFSFSAAWASSSFFSVSMSAGTYQHAEQSKSIRFLQPFCFRRSVTSSLACTTRSESGVRRTSNSACLLLGADLLLDLVDPGVELSGSVGSCMAGELGA